MTFTPFDDSQTPVRLPRPDAGGYDTFAWDQYRQGVEIVNDRHRFSGTQPKIWAWSTDHNPRLGTYGQAMGFVEDNSQGLESGFLDLPEFDPVAYIQLGSDYPLPIVMNDGPGQQREASVEPLAIPFKLPSNEGPYYAHCVGGELMDGNNLDSIHRASSQIEQFVECQEPVVSRFFLDEGADYFGNVPRDAYVPTIETKIRPFDDTQSTRPSLQVQTENATFRQAIEDLLVDEVGDMLPAGRKSATAGYSYYGNNVGQYGTDSIAFGGWALGS